MSQKRKIECGGVQKAKWPEADTHCLKTVCYTFISMDVACKTVLFLY